MDNKLHEIMNIASEECAEIIQAISKCHRFGLNNFKPGKPLTNAQHLEGEIGDLLAMVDLLKSYGVITEEGLDIAKKAKIEKLKSQNYFIVSKVKEGTWVYLPFSYAHLDAILNAKVLACHEEN